MNKNLQRLMVSGAILLLGALPLFAQNTGQQLYGITALDNQLISVDPSSGQGTLVGPLNAIVSGYGIAARYGRLYTFDPNKNDIVQIDPATATLGNSINIGVTNLQGEGDLAFRGDGVGFLTSALHADGSVANDLYSFDVIAGTAQRIGTTTEAVDALAFDNSNTLYALGKDDTNLYTINQSNGTMTAVGPLGIAMSSPFAGMTFGPDGTLYAAINDQLYVINKTNGAASPSLNTNVLDFGFSSVSGLAFQTPRAPTQLVGITAGNELFSVNLSNGAGSLIGNLGTNVSGDGLGMSSNVLYTFEASNGRIVEINPTTGNEIASINVGLTNAGGQGGLAFANNGSGFLAVTNEGTNVGNALYSFNLAKGSSLLVSNTSMTLTALAFGTNQLLYALGPNDSNLYIVNQTNAALSLVGPLGVSASSAYTGLAFGASGVLYAAINDRLYTINLTNGAATTVATNTGFGFGNVSGLASIASPAQLTLATEGTNMVIFGVASGYTLESSTNVAGPYTATSFQGDPSRVTRNAPQMYFVLRHN